MANETEELFIAEKLYGYWIKAPKTSLPGKLSMPGSEQSSGQGRALGCMMMIGEAL